MKEKKEQGRSQSIEKLIKDNNLKIIAEIGVYHCQTVKHVLKTCPNIKEYWAIDPWIDKKDQKSWDQAYEYACRLMLFFPKLKIIRLTSKQAFNIFPEKYFDLIFIDALHDFLSVMYDISYWKSRIKLGKYLTGHDYKSKRHPEVTEAVNIFFNVNDITTLPGGIWLKRI